MSLTILLVAWTLASPSPTEVEPVPAKATDPATSSTETVTPPAPPPEGAAPLPAEGPPPPEGSAPLPAEGPPPPEGSAPLPTEGLPPPEGSAPLPEGPAPLPAEGPPPPADNAPRAWGGAVHAPLPRPPASVDPSTLTAAPWRGRFWLGVGLAASIPLGGRPPAAGGVVSVAGELSVGGRVHRYLGLLTAVSTFAHDAGRRSVTLDDGTAVTQVELGRITAFDVLTARVFAPVHRRIEPWVELGAGVGVRRGPFAVERQAVGLIRAGAGVDFWLAPALTLGASTAYRVTMMGDAVGHGLRIGADLGFHW